MIRISQISRLVLTLRRFCTAPAKTSEPKLTKAERLKNYFKLIADDYITVGKETWQDMKDRKLKTTVIFGLIGVAGYLMKTRPDEQNFVSVLLDNSSELLLVGDTVRNPDANNVIQDIFRMNNEGRLRYLNLGVATVVWHNEYDKRVDLYQAQCKHLKPGIMDRFTTRFIDVGIAGHWPSLEKCMKDYDVNPAEWSDEENVKNK